MNSRERIRRIIAGESADRCGYWTGNPHRDTWPIYMEYFKAATKEEVRLRLGDDVRWIPANVYHSPRGDTFFIIPNKTAHGMSGPLAECRTPDDIECYAWPNPDYFDFAPTVDLLREAGEFYRASGLWTPFYHHVMDLFGMEQYLVNMHEAPELVHAVTDRVCEFFYAANARFFEAARGEVDGFFFGNDFGTQLDLIVGPAQFEEFILPWFRKFTRLAHEHGLQVILHSCGAIHKVIDRLIAAEVNALHPLQAQARNMDAATLARDFGGRIAFMGGIDTQHLLVRATPEEVREDVRRVKRLLGPRLIVSPSHEALLPNVPPENVEAMAQAAIE